MHLGPARQLTLGPAGHHQPRTGAEAPLRRGLLQVFDGLRPPLNQSLPVVFVLVDVERDHLRLLGVVLAHFGRALLFCVVDGNVDDIDMLRARLLEHRIRLQNLAAQVILEDLLLLLRALFVFLGLLCPGQGWFRIGSWRLRKNPH